MIAATPKKWFSAGRLALIALVSGYALYVLCDLVPPVLLLTLWIFFAAALLWDRLAPWLNRSLLGLSLFSAPRHGLAWPMAQVGVPSNQPLADHPGEQMGQFQAELEQARALLVEALRQLNLSLQRLNGTAVTAPPTTVLPQKLVKSALDKDALGHGGWAQRASADNTNVAELEALAAIAPLLSEVEAVAMEANLFALNAAIASVSAGEAGRSFGTAAEEVCGLALQARSFAQQVRARIQQMHPAI